MFLKLNLSKFYLIYFSKAFRLIESLHSIEIPSNLSLTPSSTIHSLGFIFDFSLSLIPQIKSVTKSSFSIFAVSSNRNISQTIQPQTTSFFAYFVPL